jgi:hypothetical protein
MRLEPIGAGRANMRVPAGTARRASRGSEAVPHAVGVLTGRARGFYRPALDIAPVRLPGPPSAGRPSRREQPF